MTAKSEFSMLLGIGNILSFFLGALFARMLWNGVGHTILNLPPITYWQMLGLTILVAFILPRNYALTKLIEMLVFDDKGNRR